MHLAYTGKASKSVAPACQKKSGLRPAHLETSATSALRSLLKAKPPWFPKLNVIKIDRLRSRVTKRDNEKSGTLTAPNPRPLLVDMIRIVSTHQYGNDRSRLVHNHPSGDPTPSHADIQMTKSIQEIAKPLGIALHDHIIVGKEGHASLKGLRLI
jgi:hypothetical protein